MFEKYIETCQVYRNTSQYIMKLFFCIILQAFSNQTWFDLNSQYSLKFFAKACFFIDVNTSPIKYHTSNIILVCLLKSNKKKEEKNIKAHLSKTYLSKRRKH